MFEHMQSAHAQDNDYLDIRTAKAENCKQIPIPNIELHVQVNELSISIFSDLWSVWQLMVDQIYPYLFLFTQVTLLGGNHYYSELRCF